MSKKKKQEPKTLEELSIVSLKIDTYNPRFMSMEMMERLIKSIKQFGVVDPIVINADNTVIGGHQRVIACQQIGIEKIPVVRVDLNKTEEKMLNLALNRIQGDWDLPKLHELLGELKDDAITQGLDIDITGWSMPEIDTMLLDWEEGGFTPERIPKERPEYTERAIIIRPVSQDIVDDLYADVKALLIKWKDHDLEVVVK